MSYRKGCTLLSGCVAVLVTGSLLAQDQPSPAAKPLAVAAQSQPAAAHPGFEKLKKLAGEWVPADEAAQPTSQPARDREGAAPPTASPPMCTYRVVSAGSAVQETLFPGTPHEMVTMYYLDGPELVLTHYCAMGNQPRMKAERSADPARLEFKFVGGDNIKPAQDAHMHDLTLTFVDADHIRADWTLYRDGKQSGVKTFDLRRKR